MKITAKFGKIYRTLSLCVMATSAILLAWTIGSAYLFAPGQMVIIAVNKFHEGAAETILWIGSIPGVFWELRRIIQENAE